MKSFLLLLLFSFLFLPPAQAFTQWQKGENAGEAIALIRGLANHYDYPENRFFYPDGDKSGLAGVGRLIVEGQQGERFSYEINGYQTYIPSTLLSGQSGLTVAADVERSAAFEWSFSDKDYIRLALDRLNFRWSHERLDLTIGRQAINLATTFYFTPNDLFAPFDAQTFYRVYKPGVDAARSEFRLGDLTQLSFIAVLGYKEDRGNDTGWKKEPDSDQSSHLLRLNTVYRDTDWALIAGKVRKEDLIGLSLQGEIMEWLGVRAEGHVTNPGKEGLEKRSEITVGVEHRWENSFQLRLEHFYHGKGATTKNQYSRTSPSYLARSYLALGAGYEFTPLLLGEGVLLSNLIDHSHLLALNTIYSLSDEAELVFNLSLPLGEEPKGFNLKSEFGAYPRSGTIEIRHYF